MKFIFTLLFLCCCTKLFAQIKINGTIQNNDLEPATHAKITNLKTNAVSYADNNGNYIIDAQRGDSLLVSSLGYWITTWQVPSGMGSIHKNFMLNRKAKEIDEVHIKSKTKYQLDSTMRAENNAKINNISTKETYQSPVTAIYKMFSNKYKNIAKLQEQIKMDEKQKFIATKYNVKLVNELTKLDGDTAAMFINAYPMEYDYARTASDLEIKMWIKNNYKESLLQAQIKSDKN